MRPSPSVLLAEDEPVIASEIQEILEENGFRVIRTSDGPQVLDACRQHRPDLVVLNFRQPLLPDGMALARTLKQHFGLPVVLVTGAHARELAASADFDATLPVLYKPFTRAQFRRFLHRWPA